MVKGKMRRKPLVSGAHMIVYSKDPEADRPFFRDCLKLSNVDAGHGWLIFALPGSEAAFHPGKNGTQQMFLLTDDIEAFVAAMKRQGRACSPLSKQRWGTLTYLKLPAGGKIGVYQPSHPRPRTKA